MRRTDLAREAHKIPTSTQHIIKLSIREYHNKRDFMKTPEPVGNTDRRTKSDGMRFVVQKHDARRLHYDFRLETNLEVRENKSNCVRRQH